MDDGRTESWRARFETWATWLVPIVLAALAVGGWCAWRWWTAPAPYACPILF